MSFYIIIKIGGKMKKLIFAWILLVLFGCYCQGAIHKAPSVSVSDVEVAPVPWVPEDDSTNNGTLAQGILFNNIPEQATIYIYTVDGLLIKQIAVANHTNQDYIVWDGKNNVGIDAASGVYVWVVKSVDDKKTGKLMLIR
jgi:hypothetical protein